MCPTPMSTCGQLPSPHLDISHTHGPPPSYVYTGGISRHTHTLHSSPLHPGTCQDWPPISSALFTLPPTPSTAPPRPSMRMLRPQVAPFVPSTPAFATRAPSDRVACAVHLAPCSIHRVHLRSHPRPRWHPSHPCPLNRLHSRSRHSTADHHAPPLPTYPLTHTGTHVPHLPPQDNLPHVR